VSGSNTKNKKKLFKAQKIKKKLSKLILAKTNITYITFSIFMQFSFLKIQVWPDHPKEYLWSRFVQARYSNYCPTNSTKAMIGTQSTGVIPENCPLYSNLSLIQ